MTDFDPSLALEVTATVKMLAVEAIRDALIEVASASSLSPDEEQLLEIWRASSDNHKTSALRLLERGLPTEPK